MAVRLPFPSTGGDTLSQMASARAATADDYALFARFFAELDATGPTPTEDWWQRSYGDALFVEEGSRVFGYAFAYRLGRELGHVGHLVVDPALRGRGLGRVVMDAVADRLRALGCRRWELYVVDSNAAAIALYRRCGLHVKGPVHEIQFDGAALAALPVDPAVSVEHLESESDPVVESAFVLPEGRIARVRRLPGRSFFVARRDGELVGAIAFEPSSRSTPFICARSAAIARALITAVAPDGEARLFVNADVELSKALTAAGGRILRNMLQMEGSLA